MIIYDNSHVVSLLITYILTFLLNEINIMNTWWVVLSSNQQRQPLLDRPFAGVLIHETITSLLFSIYITHGNSFDTHIFAKILENMRIYNRFNQLKHNANYITRMMQNVRWCTHAYVCARLYYYLNNAVYLIPYESKFLRALIQNEYFISIYILRSY